MGEEDATDKLNHTDIVFESRAILTGNVKIYISEHPIVPGHIVIQPVSSHIKFDEMTNREMHELVDTIASVQEVLNESIGADNFNFSWKEDESSKPFKIHILPRFPNDHESLGYEARSYLYRPPDRDTNNFSDVSEAVQKLRRVLGYISAADPQVVDRGDSQTFSHYGDRVISENLQAVAFINRAPIVEYHTLVIPKRRVEKISELSEEEQRDLFSLLSFVRRGLADNLDIHRYDFAWNEGKIAGQSVPHVHIHVLPRKEHDGGIKVYEPPNPRIQLDITQKVSDGLRTHDFSNN